MLKVEVANFNDADRIAECTRLAYYYESKKYSPNEAKCEYPSAEYVKQDIVEHTYYKILLNDIIIGGVYLEKINETCLSIEDFCIHPDYQNKGYGTQVMHELERINSHIKVWTLVTPTYSITNQALYKKLGYKDIGVGIEDGVEVIKYKKEL